MADFQTLVASYKKLRAHYDDLKETFESEEAMSIAAKSTYENLKATHKDQIRRFNEAKNGGNLVGSVSPEGLKQAQDALSSTDQELKNLKYLYQAAFWESRKTFDTLKSMHAFVKEAHEIVQAAQMLSFDKAEPETKSQLRERRVEISEINILDGETRFTVKGKGLEMTLEMTDEKSNIDGIASTTEDPASPQTLKTKRKREESDMERGRKMQRSARGKVPRMYLIEREMGQLKRRVEDRGQRIAKLGLKYWQCKKVKETRRRMKACDEPHVKGAEIKGEACEPKRKGTVLEKDGDELGDDEREPQTAQKAGIDGDWVEVLSRDLLVGT